MTTPTASLTVRKILSCRPEKAFRAWTEPAQLQQWFTACSGKMVAEMDVRVGGKYRFAAQHDDGGPTIYIGGEFLVIEAPRRLEFTWIYEKESKPEWTDRSVVKVAFNPLPEGRTEIVLTHELISDPAERENHAKGWTRIIENMAAAMAQP